MREKIGLLITVLLAVFIVTACGGGGGGGSDPAPSNNTTTYSIAGTVTSSGTGMSGVTVSLSGASTATATTDSSGNYSFPGLANGSYTITPSMTGYTLTPASSSQTVNGANITAVNFTAVTTTTVHNQVSGTAAAGTPLANFAITIIDSAGHTSNATTGTDGKFVLDTTGFTPPFLLQVTTGTGTKLYSVSADSNSTATINVTPLTDMIIRAWYNVQGITIDTAFANLGTNPAPSPTSVQIINNVIMNVVQLWLNKAGVDASNFNLISTAFSANGTGIDQVLDWSSVTINTTGQALLISDGTTTQNTTIAVVTSTGAIDVATTTTSGGVTSSSAASTVVTTQNAQQMAIDGILSTLTNLATVINAKGASLQGSDITPYLDPNLLNDGANQTQLASQLAAIFSAGSSVTFAIQQIKSLDITNNVAEIIILSTLSQGGQTQSLNLTFNFKKSGGTWLISGNQRIARVTVQAEMRTNQGAYASNSGPYLDLVNNSTQGTVTAVSVSSSSMSTITLPFNSTIIDSITGNMDKYATVVGPLSAPLPSAGTLFTFNLTKAAGGSVSYTEHLNAFTNESISITNLTGSSLSAFIGAPLTVNWTLPKTYAISKISLQAEANVGAHGSPGALQCYVHGSILGITATSGAITIPTTCGGQALTSASINIFATGVNGEISAVFYQLQ